LDSGIIDRLRAINSGASEEEANDILADERITWDAAKLYLDGSNKNSGRDPYAQGVFAGWPAMTPKYMRHVQGRSAGAQTTMARMYVKARLGKGSSAAAKKYKRFSALLDSFPEPGTQEIASILMGDGSEVGGLGYFDFFLQRVDHPIHEKFQVVETLSDNYVAFFFGQQAPVFSYSGVVMNTYQDDWAMRLLRMFRDITRGSQLARRGLLFYIKYDSMIVSGAMMNLHFTINASTETAVPFSFQLLVKKVHIVQGGIAPPTMAPEGDTFIPENYQLVETKYTKLTPKVSKPSGENVTGGTVQTPAAGGDSGEIEAYVYDDSPTFMDGAYAPFSD